MVLTNVNIVPTIHWDLKIAAKGIAVGHYKPCDRIQVRQNWWVLCHLVHAVDYGQAFTAVLRFISHGLDHTFGRAAKLKHSK